MADAKIKLSQLAEAFEIATALHDEELTKVKDAALRNKAQCEQFVTDMARKYQALADTVQAHLDKVPGLIDQLRPLIHGGQQLEKKRTATKHSVKTSRAKRGA
jgi:hypothetical protein